MRKERAIITTTAYSIFEKGVVRILEVRILGVLIYKKKSYSPGSNPSNSK